MNKTILITGCQRSGTTLVHLILDSHPQITGVDEMDFFPENLSDYQHSRKYAPYVSFKLPFIAQNIQYIRQLGPARTFWCLREPKDVVSSMLNLKLTHQKSGGKISWAIHPLGALQEIEFCYEKCREFLDPAVQRLAAEHARRKQKYDSSRAYAVLSALLCWKIKNEMLQVYDKEKISYRVLVYESLIQDPRGEIMKMLNRLKIPWHDQVLRHHTSHDGFSVGETRNTRPIDKESIGKWKNTLDEKESGFVDDVCLESYLKIKRQVD